MVRLSRRRLLRVLPIAVGGSLPLVDLLFPKTAWAAATTGEGSWQLSDAEWRGRLSPQAYAVLRGQGTERPFTSPLLAEKRNGIYACAGCGLPLFSSDAKYESGTG